MAGLASWAERRRGLRVPVRGLVVVHADGQMHGTLENLSHNGALLNMASRPRDAALELELRLERGGGRVTARAVRTEATATRWRIAVEFERVDPETRDAIDATIDGAMSAARRRPILVIDDHRERRAFLAARLSEIGMTPLTPATPLEAIDLLARSHLHVNVCMLAAGFGVPSNDLAAVLCASFPWVTTTEISDDIDASAGRALEAWAATPVARIDTAIG
jgi:CheY-like chemotaxis protein